MLFVLLIITLKLLIAYLEIHNYPINILILLKQNKLEKEKKL